MTAVVQILLYPNLCCTGATDKLRSLVLNKIKPDVLVDIVFQDNLITIYGSFSLTSYTLCKLKTVSDRMRLMAKLVIKL